MHSPVHAITGQTVQLYCNFSLPRGRIFVISGGSGLKPSSCIATSRCQKVESLLLCVFVLCFLVVFLLVVVVV